MDRLDAMRTFAQVVDSASFTRAAELLQLHKATVSQTVRQLEAQLGVRLLTRTTRSVAPTAEGLAYHQRIGAILQQVDEAEATLRQGARSASGSLRVDVPVSLGRLVLMPEVRGLLDRHPRLVLELGCTDRTVDLVKEGVDCAIRGGALPDSSLVGRHLCDVPFLLCAAPRYLDAHGLPEQPADLARHLRVGFRQSRSGQVPDVRITRDGQTHAVAMPTRFITNDSGAVLSAGLDGLGIVQLASFVAGHHLASGALVRVLPAWQCPAMPLHLVAPSSKHRTARVQAFMEWAQAVIRRRLASAATEVPMA